MNNEEKVLQMLEKQGETLTKLAEKVDRMEITLSEVGQRSERTQVLLEADYADKLQLLFDGHKTIPETLAPKSRLDALAEDMDTLKTVVRLLTHDVAELKKAQ